MLTSGAMTRQLQQLEKRGLIQRQINPPTPAACWCN